MLRGFADFFPHVAEEMLAVLSIDGKTLHSSACASSKGVHRLALRHTICASSCPLPRPPLRQELQQLLGCWHGRCLLYGQAIPQLGKLQPP